MAVPSFAFADITSDGNSGNIPLNIQSAASTFSVSVPSSLPVTVSAAGAVSVSDNAVIQNNSAGPVKVTDVSVTSQNGWTLKPFLTNFKAQKVGSKEYTLKINDIDVYSGTDTLADTFGSIEGGGSKPISYASSVAVQSSSINQTMADVVFTVEWDVQQIPIEPVEEDDPLYLTFSSNQDFELGGGTGKTWDGVLEYSTDTENWTEWDGEEPMQSEGGVLYLRGHDNSHICSDEESPINDCTAVELYCSGNIETLLDYYTVEDGGEVILGEHCFQYLFYYMDNLFSAPDLPSTTLADSCYAYMFSDCTSLTYVPELPATELANYCYAGMFINCESLTSAPELPATTLAEGCYIEMFWNCTGLTSAPELPATTLSDTCYYEMFLGCTSLISAPALPATTLAEYCYSHMFADCTSLIDIPALSATTLDYGCYSRMFVGCSNIKLSSTQTDTYTKAYRVPYTGTGNDDAQYIRALSDMFDDTGGTFAGTPDVNTTYYLDSSNSIVLPDGTVI